MKHAMLVSSLLLLLGGELSAQIPRRNVVAAARLSELVASSSSLSRPEVLRGTKAGLLVADYGDNQLKLFDVTGRLVKRIGRHGAGPGEYRDIMDAQVTATGKLVIADPKNGRVSWYSEAGEFIEAFSPGHWTYRVLPFNDSVLVITSAGDSSLVTYVAGKRRGAVALPMSYRFLDTLGVAGSRDGIAGPDGALFMVFTYTGMLGRLQSGAPSLELFPGVVTAPWPAEERRKRRLPDGREAVFRGLPPEIRPVTRAIAADRGRLAILSFEAQSGSRHLDIYASRTMAYACSVRVPDRVQNIAFSAGRLFGLVDDPEPMLVRIEAAPTAGAAPLCAF